MKNLALLIGVFLILTACARNDFKQVSLIEVFDGRDNKVSDKWEVKKEGNDFYWVTNGLWQMRVNKDPSKIEGIYRLWEDGNRVKEGKLTEEK